MPLSGFSFYMQLIFLFQLFILKFPLSDLVLFGRCPLIIFVGFTFGTFFWNGLISERPFSSWWEVHDFDLIILMESCKSLLMRFFTFFNNFHIFFFNILIIFQSFLYFFIKIFYFFISQLFFILLILEFFLQKQFLFNNIFFLFNTLFEFFLKKLNFILIFWF